MSNCNLTAKEFLEKYDNPHKRWTAKRIAILASHVPCREWRKVPAEKAKEILGKVEEFWSGNHA